MDFAPIAYSNTYLLQLPPDHRFPITKYADVKDQLIYEGTSLPEHFFDPGLLDPALVLLAHSQEWHQKIRDLTLSPKEWRRLGLPPSATNLYYRSLSSCAGTLEAAKLAHKHGAALNLAGGTHHAYRDRGEGFSVFNDLAITSLFLLQHKLASRVAIVDLDVHQGNGTASLLGHRSDVFTLSIHCSDNYPLKKEKSHLDIGLKSGTSDELYLIALEKGLEAVRSFQPDSILFQAGVDIVKGDKLGKLEVSIEACKTRDEMVISYAKNEHIPITITAGGGYNQTYTTIIEAHCNTYRTVFDLYEWY